jgi:hypothetical protein
MVNAAGLIQTKVMPRSLVKEWGGSAQTVMAIRIRVVQHPPKIFRTPSNLIITIFLLIVKGYDNTWFYFFFKV